MSKYSSVKACVFIIHDTKIQICLQNIYLKKIKEYEEFMNS